MLLCKTQVETATNSDENRPDSKIHGANMGPTWGRHVCLMNIAMWVDSSHKTFSHKGSLSETYTN